VNLSVETAQRVRSSDDEIDAMNRQMYLKVQEAILDKPDRIESLIHLLSVSRHLERIADHATNIAEDVIYMIEGQIVRHQTENYK
jgi:phosphate transport system protein